MMTAENNTPASSQLPAQFLAYKQKAEEKKAEPPRMGNTNCWGSFSLPQMMADPRTSVNSMVSTTTTSNDGFGSSEPSYYGSNSNSNGNSNSNEGGNAERYASSSSSGGTRSPPKNKNTTSGGGGGGGGGSNNKMSAMWSSFSKISNRLTGVDSSSLEVNQTHSAELDSKAGFPNNSNMTNVDRLKSMAASSVRKPEIPDVPEQQETLGTTIPTQSSFPSLASSHSSSDGSPSKYDSGNAPNGGGGGGGRFWSMGNTFFSKSSNTKVKTPTGIGSHEDPSVGELKSANKTSSFFPSVLSTSKAGEKAKQDIDVDKLKRLRDQAAGLVPQSPGAFVEEEKQQQQQPEEEQQQVSLESQIDDLEKEMGITMMDSKSAAAAAAAAEVPPKLRMDGFDDVHEAVPTKNYAEITLSTSVGSMDRFINNTPVAMPKTTAVVSSSPVTSAFSAMSSSSPKKSQGLSTTV